MTYQEAEAALVEALRNGLTDDDPEHAESVIQHLAAAVAPWDMQERLGVATMLWDFLEEALATGSIQTGQLPPVPEVLYHATTAQAARHIRTQGLRPTSEGIFLGTSLQQVARYVHTHHGAKLEQSLPFLVAYSQVQEPEVLEDLSGDLDDSCFYALAVSTAGLDATRFERWPMAGYYEGVVFSYPDPIPTSAFVARYRIPLLVVPRPER